MDNLFQMLAGTADGVFVIKEDQRIVYWNKAAQQMLGYTAREVIGRNCYEILKGCDDEARLICGRRCRVTAAALGGNTMPNYDVAAQTKSGDLRWINVSILSFPPSGHESTLFIIHLFHDATQKKYNEQFIRHLLDATKYLQTRTGLTSIPVNEISRLYFRRNGGCCPG